MTPQNQQFDELLPLLEGLCEDRLSTEETARLEQLVCHDTEARWLYLTYIDLHGTLYWDTAVTPAGVPDAAALVTRSGPVATVSAGADARPPRRGRRAIAAAVSIGAMVLIAALVALFAPTRPEQPIVQQDRQNIEPSPEQPKPSPRIHGPVRISTPIKSAPEATHTAQSDTERHAADETPNAPADGPHGSGANVVAFINDQIGRGWQSAGIKPSPVAEDTEWIRRVYLDLVGHIPTADEVEAVLADRRPEKRAVLVDRLLDDPAYVRNWTTVWTNLLIGRSTARNVDRDALEKFLRMSFAENRPWSEVVAELISAEGKSNENGATNYLLAHLNNEAVPATAITARLFLGVQVHCTQCHPHPFNNATQEQFWSLNSFFQQTEPVVHFERDKTGRRKRSFEELVTKEVGGPIYYETRTGLMRVAYPKFEGVDVDPGAQVNRRRELARLMTSGEKPQMAEAFVNRLWNHFFGQGFTRPVDDMGPHNPASHPELLDRLAREFVASGYDVKQLIRWICTSEPYQLSSRMSDGNTNDDPLAGDVPRFSHLYVKAMTAEQLYDSLLIATKAQYAGQENWTAAEELRQEWLQQFVIAFDTEENDETTTFDGTVPQALMMMNGQLIEKALSPAPGTYLGDVLRSNASEMEKVRKLCLAALSRTPTNTEMAGIRKLLGERAIRGKRAPNSVHMDALQDVFWAFLNSNEFILVH